VDSKYPLLISFIFAGDDKAQTILQSVRKMVSYNIAASTALGWIPTPSHRIDTT